MMIHKRNCSTMELHLLLAFFLFLVSQESFLFLGGLAVFSSFTSFANLKTAGLSLVGEHFAASLLSLLLVDELHQDTLVLENVTLGFHVQVVVEMAINFLGLTIAFQKPSQHSHASDPHELLGHTGISSTLPLTKATVTALATGFCVLTDAGT